MSGAHYLPRRRPVQLMPVEVAVFLFAGWHQWCGLVMPQAAGMVACLYTAWGLVGLLITRTRTP